MPDPRPFLVLDAAGKPVPGAIVTPIVGDRKPLASLVAGSDGSVSLPIDAKMFSLVVRVPGKGLDWVDFQGAPPASIRLAPATHLRACFVDASGKAAVGATVVPKFLIRHAEGERFAAVTTLSPEIAASLTTKTGPDGAAEIDGLPQGTEVRLDVADVRYAHPQENVALAGAVTDAKPIRLVPGATVSGLVLRDGKGVPGIRVEAQAQRGMGWGEGITDANGRYLVTCLTPDAYNVALDLGTFPERTAPAFDGLVLRQGERTQGKDFRLVTGSVVSGRVVDAAGKPRAELPIGIYGPAHPQSGGWVQTATTDADGNFRFRVPAGAQYVYIMDGVHKADQRLTTVAGAEKTVEFRIPVEKAPYKGRVLDEKGQPIAGATVTIDYPRDDEAHRYDDSTLTSDADGFFEVPGDTAFPLSIRARKGDLATPGALRISEKAYLGAILAKGNLRAATGTVLDAAGRPIPNATVDVTRWNSSGMGYGGTPTKTDAKGRFRVDGLWPDQQVSVDATAGGYGEGQTRQVSLEGDVTDLGAVRLPKADSFIAGRIDGEDGKPVAGARVGVGMMHPKEVLTDAQGRFRVDGIPKGKAEVRVSRGGMWLNRSLDAGRADHVLVLKKPALASVPAPAIKPLKVGDAAPELATSTWLNAKPTTLAALRGRVVVLDFWAIWCGPCRQELPNVVKLAKRLKGRNATVIGLHDSSTWQKELTGFAKKNGLTYALAVDKVGSGSGSFGRTMRAYGVVGIPTVVVIDPKGKVAYVGDAAGASATADRLLSKPAL